MREIEIRLLRLDEAEALVELAASIWRACFPGIISSEQIEYMLAQRYKPGLVRQLLARGDLWLAALAGDELIAIMRELLMPQTTVLTPNSLEARRLAESDEGEAPALDVCGARLAALARRYGLSVGPPPRVRPTGC